MKYRIKDLNKAIIFLGVILSVASCGNDEEFFSCDPEVDTWAKSNITEIQEMSREDFLAIGDLVYQKAAYVAMREEQRNEIWMTKLKDVLQLEGWTREEEQHIESLISFIGKNESLFANSETKHERDQFELFMHVWVEYAEEVLGWDRETIFSICGTPDKAVRIENEDGGTKLIVPKVSEFKTAVRSPSTKTRNENGGGGEGFDCMCSQVSDFCDIFKEIPMSVLSCNTGNGYVCKVIPKRCGLFWLFDCDGACKCPMC